MEIKKVTAMYLSCTGTTKKIVEYVAKNVAERLSAEYEVFDFSLPAARKTTLLYSEDELVICRHAVYAASAKSFFAVS